MCGLNGISQKYMNVNDVLSSYIHWQRAGLIFQATGQSNIIMILFSMLHSGQVQF